jgi:hypothetical protein
MIKRPRVNKKGITRLTIEKSLVLNGLFHGHKGLPNIFKGWSGVIWGREDQPSDERGYLR